MTHMQMPEAELVQFSDHVYAKKYKSLRDGEICKGWTQEYCYGLSKKGLKCKTGGRRVEKQKASFNDKKLYSKQIKGRQQNWQNLSGANPEKLKRNTKPNEVQTKKGRK